MKNILGVFVIILLSFQVQAQHLEAGALLGVSYYEGDLTKSDLGGRISEMNFGGGIFARYNINRLFATKLGFNFGRLTGADDPEERVRNLSFSSRIFEASLVGEFNILGYQPYNLEEVFSPYLFGGIAIFKFNPTAELNGQTYDLQPLGTEGQGTDAYPEREPYSLTQFSIPMGVGVKFALNDKWNIGIEGGLRFTFTDYLDDVSETYVGSGYLLETNGPDAAALADRSGNNYPAGTARGNEDVRDYYFFGGLTFSYNFLDNGLVGSRNRRGGKTGCPTF